MKTTIHDILARLTEGQEGTVEIDASQSQELYERACQDFGKPSPIVTIVRTDTVLLWQFSEYGRLRIKIEDRKGILDRRYFSFIKNLDYVDAVGQKQSFLQFLFQEVKGNVLWLLMISVVYLAVLFSISTRDGLSNMFNVITQVVSIFTAVYVVFVAVQAPRTQEDTRLFAHGYLSEYHRDDQHLTILAVIAIFTSLFATIVVKTSKTIPASFTIGDFHQSSDGIAILIGALGLIQLLEVAILFLSLPQYYLKRSKNFLFSDLSHKVLDEHYDDLHENEHEGTIVPFSSTDSSSQPH